MRILIVTGIFPPDLGGPATYVPRIALELKERGHEIVGVLTLVDKFLEKPEIYAFPVLQILRNTNRIFRFIKVVKMMVLYARKSDVVYLNGLVLEGILAAKLILRNSVVVKVVGDLIWEKAQNVGATQDSIDIFQIKRQTIKWEFLKYFQGWYTAKADIVITPSKYLAEMVQQWGVERKRTRVIYNSIEQDGLSEITPDSPKLYDLVTVVRLVPWKGLHSLIELVALNGWTLRIVGDGPLMEDLKLLVKNLNVAERVSFAGKVSKDKVGLEIQSAKIFVLNSSYEGLPHIILEAKAYGVPVVATAAGGSSETIDDGMNGYLVAVGDVVVLVDRLRYLLANSSERVRISINGRNQVASQFSLLNMVSLTEQALLFAISKKVRR